MSYAFIFADLLPYIMHLYNFIRLGHFKCMAYYGCYLLGFSACVLCVQYEILKAFVVKVSHILQEELVFWSGAAAVR